MNTVRKDNKSDIHNETDMTEVQYKNITDQAQGTGNLLGIINVRLIQMDVNAESRRLEVKGDIEKSAARVEKSVAQVEKSVTQVEKSVTQVEKRVTQVEKRVTRLEESVTRLEESVTQVAKSVETLGLKTEQDIKDLKKELKQDTKELKQELKKDIEDLRGSVNRDLRLIMLSIGTIGAVLIPLTMAIVYKLFI